MKLIPAVLFGLIIWPQPSQQMFIYQCPKCGLTQQYTRTGMYRCPNDHMLMFQVRDR